MIKTALSRRLDELAPGVHAHRRRWGYTEGSRVTAEQLDLLQSRLGLPLPEEYRAFVTRFGTGGFDLLTPDEVLRSSRCSTHGGWGHVTHPFAVTDGHGRSCCAEDEMLHGTVVITRGACAFYTALAVTSASAGTVWCNDYVDDGHDDEFRWAPAGARQTEPPAPLDFLSWIEGMVSYQATRRPRRWFLPRRLR